MDHIEIYPLIVKRVDSKVAAGSKFTAFGLCERLQVSLGVQFDYRHIGRPAVHTAMVQYLVDGSYDRHLKDFGGQWDAWEYKPVPKYKQPKMHGLVSSVLAAAGYNPDEGHLWVCFVDGSLGFYDRIGASVFAELMAADSHGKFYNEFIKNSGHAYTKI